MDPHLNKLLKRKKQLKCDGRWKDYADCVHEVAYYLQTKGECGKSVAEFRELAAFYATKKDELNFAKVHRFIGEIYLEQGDFKEALANEFIHYNKVSALNDAAESQRALATLSRIYLTQAMTSERRIDESLQKAKKYAEMSLSKCDEVVTLNRFEREDMKARVFQNLSLIHEHLSELETRATERNELMALAIKYVLRSLEICKEIDNFKVLYQTHFTTAQLYQKKHEYRNALYHIDEALQLVPRLKHGGDKVAAHYELYELKAQQFLKLDDYNGAQFAAAKAYRLFSGARVEQEKMLRRAKLIVLLARCEKRLITIALDEFRARKRCYETMGDACCELDEFEKAVRFYRAMLECCEQDDVVDAKEMAACFVSLAMTYKDLGDWSESLRFFRKELALYRDLENDWKSIVETLKNMAEIERNLNPSQQPNRFYCTEIDRLRAEQSDCGPILDRIHQRLIKSEKGDKNNDDDDDDDEDNSNLNNSTTLNLDDIDISDILNEDEKTDLDGSLASAKSQPLLSIPDGLSDSRKRQKEKFRVKKNMKGETQLHTACIDGKFELCRQLLAQGHPVNVRDGAGWLPLHEAANYGHTEICELLLKYGAFVNDSGGKDCCGITPLLDAAINGHLETCELLIRNGASVIAKTYQGQTVLDHLRTANENFEFEGDRAVLYKRLSALVSSALEKTVKLRAKEAAGVGSMRKSLDDNRPVSPVAFSRQSSSGSLPVDSEATRVYSDTIGMLRRRGRQLPHPESSNDTNSKDDDDDGDRVRIVSAFVEEPATKDVDGDDDDRIMDTTDMLIDTNNWIEDDIGEAIARQKQKRNQRRSPSFESDASQRSKRASSRSQPETPIQLPPTTAINVRIDSKLFRVPVSVDDSRALTLQWLADEACERFVRMNGNAARPEIQLKTVDGALMSHSDRLYTILTLDTIDSIICSWQTVPLCRQFREACKDEKIEPSVVVLKQIDSIETITCLSLRNQMLDTKTIRCLIKSLRDQRTLNTLDVSGNRFDSELFNGFLAALRTLTNLNALSLQATGLNVTMLEMFTNESIGSIAKLDLSCNRLGNGAGRLLIRLLNRPDSKLGSLNISGCEFESGLFAESSSEWRLSGLECLAIAANRFDCGDLERVFRAVDWLLMRRLDLKLIPVRSTELVELCKRFYPHDRDFRNVIDFIDCY